MNAGQALERALGALSDALLESGVDHMVIGGIAAIARGLTRQTGDIDATVWAQGLALERLLGSLAAHGIEGRIPDLIPFAGESQVLLLEHVESRTPIEVSLAWLPFEREALDRAEVVSLAGHAVRVAQAEDLILYKAVAWRPRDRSDVERLMVLHGASIDLPRVRDLISQFAAALDEPSRLDEFDELIRRCR